MLIKIGTPGWRSESVDNSKLWKFHVRSSKISAPIANAVTLTQLAQMVEHRKAGSNHWS